MRRAVAVLAAGTALFLGGCGASTPADASGMERTFVDNLGGQAIKSMCDPDFTHWSCFYDGVEADGRYLVVKLSTDGGRDEGSLATQAGTHWFNFIKCDYPDLKTIIVRVNGVDHNVYRPEGGIAC